MTPIEGSAPTFRPQRVLIVEDDGDARQVLTNLVLRLGHVVQAAATGPDGFAAVAEFRPGIALIDLGLPGEDGCALARRIRGALGAGTPLLVAYTGQTGNEARAAALEAGFDRCVLEPVGLDELIALLAPQPHVA